MHYDNIEYSGRSGGHYHLIMQMVGTENKLLPNIKNNTVTLLVLGSKYLAKYQRHILHEYHRQECNAALMKSDISYVHCTCAVSSITIPQYPR